jgi:hypothetical protein
MILRDVGSKLGSLRYLTHPAGVERPYEVMGASLCFTGSVGASRISDTSAESSSMSSIKATSSSPAVGLLRLPFANGRRRRRRHPPQLDPPQRHVVSLVLDMPTRLWPARARRWRCKSADYRLAIEIVKPRTAPSFWHVRLVPRSVVLLAVLLDMRDCLDARSHIARERLK